MEAFSTHFAVCWAIGAPVSLRINIVLVSELYFTNISYINSPGYHAICVNHPENNTAHLGAAIFNKFSIAYIPLPNYITDHIQSSAILLLLSIPITIAATYLHSQLT